MKGSRAMKGSSHNTVRIKHILDFQAGLCGYELPLSGSIEPQARPDRRALSERY